MVSAKVEFNGKLPIEPMYLSALKNYNKQSRFAKVNDPWISKMYNTLVEIENGRRDLPYGHLLTHFNRQEAIDFISPLMLQIYNLTLSTKIISLFPEKADYPRDERVTGEKEISLLSSTEAKEECYEKSLAIIEKAKGQVLMIIGQTPIYVAEMIRVINESKNKNEQLELLYIPVSGRPDMVALDRDEKTWGSSYKNIMTREKEKFYREFLTSRNFFPKKYEQTTKKFYILDYSSGPSIASLVVIFAKWFADEGVKFPNFVFLNMASHENVLVSRGGEWKKLRDGEQLNFKLSDDLDINVTTEYLDFTKELFVYFADVHDDMRVIPPFNAWLWREEMLEAFINDYPRPKAIKLLRKYHNYALARLNKKSSDFLASE